MLKHMPKTGKVAMALVIVLLAVLIAVRASCSRSQLQTSQLQQTNPNSNTDDSGMPPEPPDGQNDMGSDGPPPPPPGGFGNDNNVGGPGGGMGGAQNGMPQPPPDGGREQNIATSGTYSQDGGNVTKSGQTIESTTANVSAIKVYNGGVFNLSNSTINKLGGDSTAVQNSDFRGLNAAVLAETKAVINISGGTITTNASGANAAFATGKSSTINLSNLKIVTKGKGSSRGLDATFGGTVTAKNVDISTVGIHSAALATDRGEGNITLDGGTVITTGQDSPPIYSTGNIKVSNAKLNGVGSEGAVIEGKNSITLTNSTLQAHKKCGVMLYQSFSGDAGVGTSVFTMKNGSLSAEVGPLFYCTNTKTKVVLMGAELTAKSGIFMDAAAGRWGQQGRNGSDVGLTAVNQTISGDITCDKISSITIGLNSSTLQAAVNSKQTARAIYLTLDKTSIWQVTGNSYITNLTDENKTLTNIIGNGYTVYYDVSASANEWLGGKSYKLAKGGSLRPTN